jgi:hypothetical protein
MSFTVILQQLCEANGIEVQDVNGLQQPKHKKATAKMTAKKKKEIAEYNEALDAQYLAKLKAVQQTLVEYKQATEYNQCTAESRELLTKGVVSISNYKEANGNELVESNKTVPQIMSVLNDSLVLWVFAKIQELSSLTAEEVMGL